MQIDSIVLKRTQSLCPVCRKTVPAFVRQENSEIVLHKNCPEHGDFAAVINSDPRHYHLSLGASSANETSESNGQLPVVSDDIAGCGSGCCGTSAEQLSTCVGFIEIVSSCNLSCPVCFADSPHQSQVDAMDYDEFVNRVSAVIKRKGAIDILQLSGGEPTIHPEFFRLLEWVLSNDGIGHVLLNTNGIRLNSEAFFRQLETLRNKYGKLEIYLQFDGLQANGQMELRGVDMRQTREKVVSKCQAAGIPVNLAMTVDEHNRAHLGDVLRFALDHPGVSGITWQPMFGSGRAYDGFNLTGTSLQNLTAEPNVAQVQRPTTRRLNVADIIAGAVSQSDGLVTEEDFTPLPCGDPNCHTVAYLLRQGDGLLGLASLIDLESVQGFLQDRMNYDVQDLLKCGCESEPLGHVLKELEIGKDSVLRLVIKPFMDVWTYDQHRVDRCCVHVIGPGGSLESFCRHYALS